MRFAWVALLSTASLFAAAPVIRDISPHGAQRGKSFQLLLKGTDLASGARIQTTLPGAISRLSQSADGLPFLVELKKDAPVGLYPVRVVTEDGISNVVLFSVGELPELEENESKNPKQTNGDIKSAETITIPAVVNGTLPDSDVDVFAFPVKAGQKLVFEVEASVAASAIDPAIELMDSSGRQLAKNDDAPGGGIDSRLEYSFAKAGTYYVRIHDSKYSDQPQNFYRLKIGSYFFSDGLFPLGWKRGEPVSVQLTGGNLAQPVVVKPDTNSAHRFIPVNMPNSASLPLLFLLGDKPEAFEPEGDGPKPITPGTVINGRIAKKGEVDRYKLAVKAGEQWIFELTAAATGASELDGLLTIYGPDGKKLASRDDLNGTDPALPFDVPKDVKEITVAVEDLLGRGGPSFAYRLEARKEPADFIVELTTPFVNVPSGGTALVNLRVQRRGYDGPIRLAITNLPKGFHQAGGHVAPAAASQRFDDPNPRFGTSASTISITADPGAPPQNIELAVRAQADYPDGRMIRYATGPGLTVAPRGARQKTITAPWLEMQLPMAVAKALPARLSQPVPQVRIAQGVEYPVSYKGDGALAGKPLPRLRDTIASQVGNLRILQGDKPGIILVNTNYATPTTIFDFYSQATVEVDGKPVDIYAPIITFDIAPGYQVWPDSAAWKLKQGGSLTVSGKVHREPTFEGGLVKMDVQDLPEGVSCKPAEVAADAGSFSFTCEATGAAPKGVHDVRLVSSAPDTGKKAKENYKGPEVTAKLRID